ncbi:protein FLX-like 3 [Tasmannia lanceolata]|uniref:protein FLX-like 3 n=1 Tax=Tasmannia lanceolata TaxID=3420 RepID=UPI004064B58C
MAGRNRMPLHPMDDGLGLLGGFHGGPPPPARRGPLPLHPAAMEDELVIQRDEIRRLIGENRHMVEDHLALRRELAASRDEIRNLSQVIPKLRADKEAHARELIERGLKLEAELRATEPLRIEAIQLRAEAQKLNTLRQEISAQIQGISKDLDRLQIENKQIHAMRAEIDGLRQELVRARIAIEYEQKANAEQVEQRQAMENNLISMAREVEKLRAELMSKEKRALGPGSGGYGILKGSPEMGYPGAFGDGYGGEKSLFGSSSWAGYEKHGLHRR